MSAKKAKVIGAGPVVDDWFIRKLVSIPYPTFAAMVRTAPLTDSERREFCKEFLELKRERSS